MPDAAVHHIALAPWQIDTAHTEVEFAIRHLMISTVKGRFGSVTGRVSYDPANPGAVELEVSIPVATVDTRVEPRDAHLRSADFFDVEKYPVITYVGRRVEGDVSGDFVVVGDLTIHGVTHEVHLNVSAEGKIIDPWGNERLGFSATGSIDRGDFDLRYNATLESGGVVLGEKVKLVINTELMRPKQG
ncbi:MAG TPA: YceI family protein [Gemmatimonadales bacterium]|nr:YceI family protein [Gemmatimonadales bacterium]